METHTTGKDLPTGAKEQTTSLVCTTLILTFMQKCSNDCDVFVLAIATTLLRTLDRCLYYITDAQRSEGDNIT